MYDAIVKGLSGFYEFAKVDPGMALIVLVGILYFGDKLIRHFDKGKYKNYTIKETLNHPREAFGMLLMGLLLLAGIIIVIIQSFSK